LTKKLNQKKQKMISYILKSSLSLFVGFFIILSCLLFLATCNKADRQLPGLRISDNHRYLETETGNPFFWLGDTGWLLFTKLTREEAEKYFENRKELGFNVIQVMVLHSLNAVNIYGDSALINRQIDQPNETPGNLFNDPGQYDFWDHVDYLVDLEGKKGLYMALVPVWGSNVRSDHVTGKQAAKYALWLAERYKDKPNIIWVNGGDVKGSDSTAVWNTIGKTIRNNNPLQLITYHPFGRTQSSTWFHNEDWLDFNMFQSGHRRYDQDTTDLAYGEDNWRYVVDDYSKVPVKPTLDGEPFYEGIPQGLHDTSQPLWKDNNVRRYAYWSVFAGACGFTYGHSAIMQFHKPGDPTPGGYGVKINWDSALYAPGAGQLKYLKQLMLSRPYFERVPAQNILVEEQGVKYDYQAATRGKNYAFVYTYSGRDIMLNPDKLPGLQTTASWLNPRDGSYSESSTYKNSDLPVFDPPGEPAAGNDWVLVMDFK
jgi:hypothetical protein